MKKTTYKNSENWKTPKHDHLQSFASETFIIKDLITSLNICKRELIRWIKVTNEEPVISNNEIIGFWDIFVEFQIDIDCGTNHRRYLGIEIKPEINSLGETIRQLKMYKFYFQKDQNEKKDIELFLITEEPNMKKCEQALEMCNRNLIHFFDFDFSKPNPEVDKIIEELKLKEKLLN
jgi:hypothetical protein